MKKIVIVGRPNVGKSTLFNRLAGRSLAIVDDQPGVTRDWRASQGHLGDLDFTIVDTAGLEGYESPEIKDQIDTQTKILLNEADIILFILDALEGATGSDEKLARSLRPLSDKVILIANKAEGKKASGGILDLYRLGFGDPVSISAAHGEGLTDLFEALKPRFEEAYFAEETEEPLKNDTSPIHLAFVGRPNAGKSTLINQLLGQDRLITGETPGITRDAIALDWEFKGKTIRLFDTAGLRRKSRVEEKVESLAVQDTLRAIKFAQVVILVLDSEIPLEKQDLVIASRIVEEGRGLVIALNKWDKANHLSLDEIQYQIEKTIPQAKGVFCVPISAIRGKNLNTLMEKVFETYALWNKRLPTGPLNRWLMTALERHPPPLSGANRIRIKYMTQIKSRPPTFALFITKPVELPDSYLKYLSNSLREEFGMPGVPLRFLIRKTKNPFVDDK